MTLDLLGFSLLTPGAMVVVGPGTSIGTRRGCVLLGVGRRCAVIGVG